jgi:hypothetical protein
MKNLTIEQAREIVRAQYPKATEVSTGSQMWIQSAPDGATISDAFAFRTNFHAQTKAWRSAAKNVKAGNITADAAYKIARAKVNNLLEEVNAKLTEHSNRQILDPKNWGLVGDMNHYAELLEELLGKRG